MTLAELPLQTAARVASLARVAPGERSRLDSLGLSEGATVTKLVRTPLRDPVECLVGRQLLALNASVMGAIEVEPA